MPPASPRRRSLRDLLSAGAVVGGVALGVAVVVAPAASNLGALSGPTEPLMVDERAASSGDVVVELRPSIGALLTVPTGPAAVADLGADPRRAVLAIPRSVLAARAATTLPAAAPSASTPDVQLPAIPPAELALAVPAVAVPAPAATPEVTAPARETARERQKNRKATGAAATPRSTTKTNTDPLAPSTPTMSAFSVPEAEDGSRRGGPKADNGSPRDRRLHQGQPPGAGPR